MNIIKIDELQSLVNPHGVELRKVFENESVGIMQIVLKPGEVIEKHANPVNALFLVLEGTGIAYIGDEQRKVVKNTLIEVPEHLTRGWKNDSNDILKLLVIKLLNN